MPVALSLIALQFAFGASRKWSGRIAALAFVGAVFAVGHFAPALLVKAVWPIAILILAAALLGAPVFVAMGGLALLLFFRMMFPSRPSRPAHRLIASPTLPAIPLLTAAGYILAEGGASHRLVRFFRVLLALCRAASR